MNQTTGVCPRQSLWRPLISVFKAAPGQLNLALCRNICKLWIRFSVEQSRASPLRPSAAPSFPPNPRLWPLKGAPFQCFWDELGSRALCRAFVSVGPRDTQGVHCQPKSLLRPPQNTGRRGRVAGMDPQPQLFLFLHQRRAESLQQSSPSLLPVLPALFHSCLVPQLCFTPSP